MLLLVAEEPHSMIGVLRNALDQVCKEWGRKPMSALACGSTDGAPALEQLRGIAVGLQVALVRGAVHRGGADLFAVHPTGGNAGIESVEERLPPAQNDALHNLVWRGKTTKAARQA